MEFISEAIASRNIFVWVILLVLFIVFIKLLKSVGKGFLLLVVLIGGFFLMHNFFPGLLDPLVDFVRGGWLGENRPDRPW